MKPCDQIFTDARERAKSLSLSYTGALLPAEAHAILQLQPEAKLVDIRTRAEWEWVGKVPGALLIEWNTWPGGQRNAKFLEELRAQVPNQDSPVFFLCRSGGRSNSAAAAAAAAGYTQSFNVLEGFEGDKNAQNQRNTVGGWRAAGLPWTQG